MKSTAKIISLKTLQRRLRQARREGKTVVFTNGCFDILHAGHVKYLEKARSKGDYLIVGLNSDRSVRALKGPCRPINRQEHRAEVLAGLQAVDWVCLFDEDTPSRLVAALKPDVLAKGADWKGRPVAGGEQVLRAGGKVVFIDYEEGLSTTEIIRAVQNSGCPS